MNDLSERGGPEDITRPGLWDWLIGIGLAVLSAAVFFSTTAGYVYPGEGARLAVLWRGLDTQPAVPYPLMSFFGQLFGGGNLIAPISGVVAVVCLYALVSGFLRRRTFGEFSRPHSSSSARIAGVVAAIVFMFTPAVHEAATHIEPRMFDFAWALVAALPILWYATAPASVAWALPMLSGALCGLGFADSPLFVMLIPVYVVVIGHEAFCRGTWTYGAILRWFVSFLVAFFVYAPTATGDFSKFLLMTNNAFGLYWGLDGWILVVMFATLPFLASLFAARRGLNEPVSLASWIFHVALSFATVLAVATPLSPSELMEPYGVLPVATSAFAAASAGYLVVYWRLIFRESVRSRDDGCEMPGWMKPVAVMILSLFVVILAISSTLSGFMFQRDRGIFADRAAERIVASLGERKWFITDGTLDDHLLIAAKKAGRELNLICLARDLDSKYLEQLGETVREKQVGGPKCEQLALSLSLGVLPFVQDWFSIDPTVPQQVAIFGTPDLWYGAGVRPVSEFLFFGGDKELADKTDVAAEWATFKELLFAPKNWGSYRMRVVKHPVDRMRLSLRRHLGLVENDRGVWLMDQNRNDEAFEAFERVLGDIDSDNISATFNEVEMTKTHPKAAAKQKELERQLQRVVDDKNRRYYIWQLGNFYGYIRNPEVFMRLGYTWARSGRPGEALSQLRRAVEFIPSENQGEVLNMMAALYASGSESSKSRAAYEAVLAKDAKNHDAHIGLMCLELANGNATNAILHLEQAAASESKGSRAQIEKALLCMLKNDVRGAREILHKVTDDDPKDLQAWSLLAMLTMRECDVEKDAERKRILEDELEKVILPAMQKNSKDAGDYFVQSTKAFILLRKGDKFRKEARDAFAAASNTRPDVMATQDMVINLDITLNDPEDAERHARDVLRRNRKAPLANYVMGSLALQRDDTRGAEIFLRRAADAEKPVVIAMNDLAEVLRRNKNYPEAERYARKCIEKMPHLYVAWETLGSILMDSRGDLDEAEKCVLKACELSKGENGREEDIRMVMSLARVQALKGDKLHAKMSLRKVQSRLKELNDFEKQQYEELRELVR